VVGLELKRELVVGELRRREDALLPIVAAVWR
jgi:Na+/H+ antiporter NhaA